MNLRRQIRPSPDINLTPLIDVVFLLLIFFMVSTTFQKETRIKIELPEATTEASAEEVPKVLDVSVDKDGTFYVNEKEVVNTELATLKRAIEKAARGEKDLPVVISADARTPHQAVIKVLDAASSLGFVRMTFAAGRSQATDQ